MKKFTCKEIMNSAGGCDVEFVGDNMHDVAGQCGKHVITSTDDAHKSMREMMANSKKEDQGKWFEWFQGEWDKKAEA